MLRSRILDSLRLVGAVIGLGVFLTGAAANAQPAPAPPVPPKPPAPAKPPPPAKPPVPPQPPAAQPPAPAQPPAEAPPAEPPPAVPPPAPTPPPAPAAPTPAPEPSPPIGTAPHEPAPIAPMPAPPPEPIAAPEAPPPVAPWYEAIAFGAFVDVYSSWNLNFPKPQLGTNRYRAYDISNGFALSWVGFNASYDPDPVGGTISLRFGPTAQAYSGVLPPPQVPTTQALTENFYGLYNIKQAIVSWRPGGAEGSLTLDFGKFDTIYGAEVADSQLNMNYTRGALYWLAQPLFHTGLRATYGFSDSFSLKALVVNGWNNSIDNNAGKTFGLQAVANPTDTLALYLGWIGGPEQDDVFPLSCKPNTTYDPATGNCPQPALGETPITVVVDRGGANEFDAWKHLIDLVVTLNPDDSLSLVFNADYGVEGRRDTSNATGDIDTQRYYGGMLGARYALDEVWAIAGRGEYLADPDGLLTAVKDGGLATGTLTFEAKPTDNLILRLEGRGDFMVGGENADAKKVFAKELRDTSSNQFTTTLGAVVTTN